MQKLFIFADFDWLKKPTLVGELSSDSGAGETSCGFTFDSGWLSEFGDIFFEEVLRNYPGIQYSLPGKDLFGCFADALPDRWGRTLFNRWEQIIASEENRPVRPLTSFDYLAGIADESRLGGLRFSKTKDGEFINAEESFRVPPF